MTFLTGLFAGIVSSLAVAYALWWWTYIKDKTTVIFSDEVVLTENTDREKSKYRYRIAVQNIGERNLYEVAIIAKLSVKPHGREIKSFTYVDVAVDNKLPVIYGREEKGKRPNVRTGAALSLTIGPTACKEFRKGHYSDSIIYNTDKNELLLEDIFNEYNTEDKGEWTLTMYVFGYDAKTGARKIYESKKDYKKDDVLLITPEENEIFVEYLCDWKKHCKRFNVAAG